MMYQIMINNIFRLAFKPQDKIRDKEFNNNLDGVDDGIGGYVGIEESSNGKSSS